LATGVVVSSVEMMLKLASSFRMPPISPASISPPNISPLTVTPIESMPMIGNLPSSRSEGWIRMPCTEPENSSAPRPWMPVTLADRIRTKSPGCFSMSSHWMPIASMRIGRNEGHLKLSPVAEPTLRKTPKPGLVLNVPSPRKAKLRASPAISRPPIFTVAPIAWNETISCWALAPVFRLISRPVSVTRLPSVMFIVSTLNWNESTLPPENVSWRRIASSFGVPSAFLSSAVLRSVIVAENGRPGRNFTPPDAT
jgi:hypothetical protein